MFEWAFFSEGDLEIKTQPDMRVTRDSDEDLMLKGLCCFAD